ncbi:hypothetical protein [Halalkalibacter nanhaiisediminis]|uniref:Permease n=1 Tax=Halalkalibacter nanhaiisediminis TaxID=688079 RepID=A0A562QMM4_9BACI|nr:hypothetical protein [Halalkalibacter nanhaiisediminis]TWI58011.1 hypothetical protein IQ10_01342 [Halalkalibacter nanhaiisediminis]
MKKLIIGIIVLFALWFVLPFFGINTSYIIPYVIEWSTKFILPWLVLYWLVRLVKAFEKNK